MKNVSILFLMFGLVLTSMQKPQNYSRDILGTWSVQKIELVYDDNLSEEEKEFFDMMMPILEEGLSQIQMSYYADGTMRMMVEDSEESMEEASSYILSSDGKTLTIQSEEGNDVFEVHLLNSSQMILAIRDEGLQILMHMTKR